MPFQRVRFLNGSGSPATLKLLLDPGEVPVTVSAPDHGFCETDCWIPDIDTIRDDTEVTFAGGSLKLKSPITRAGELLLEAVVTVVDETAAVAAGKTGSGKVECEHMEVSSGV